MRLLVSLALLAALSPLAALATDGPSFDCALAKGSAEKLVCSDTALATLDRRLADRYAAALTAASRPGGGGNEALRMLRASERGWIKGRDACWKSDDPHDCIKISYLRREAELVSQWMLERPTGTTIWACDGNPANEIVTSYFETEMPSLRRERGDRIDTMIQVRTASGARYDGDFGSYIWMKGDEAMYREPDPDGREMTCKVVGDR